MAEQEAHGPLARYQHLQSLGEDDVDPYQLQDPSHDPSAFYTFCGKESSTTQARVPMVYLDMIARIVASREVAEYDTPAAFIRDAIHHRLYWFTNHHRRPEDAKTITAHVLKERSVERARALQTRKDTITQLRAEYSLALQDRSRYACQQVLDEVCLALDSEEADDGNFAEEMRRLKGYIEETMRGL